MNLAEQVNTFGRAMLQRYGEPVHKLAMNVGFTCPNRDGTLGRGGCTFCNNASFNPQGRQPPDIATQIANGREVIAKRTGAKKFIAYFQAYTNTYADVAHLRFLYDQALSEPDVIGLSIGTRPDCVPDAVLDLLAQYRDRGYDVTLELGLQSSFDDTLKKVNRGHDFAAYADAMRRAGLRDLPVCTHLMLGLPGETLQHNLISLQRTLDLKTAGLKLHPLHIVRGTQLANTWRRGEYQPLILDDYVDMAVTLIQNTPPQIVFHRVTATASLEMLLAPLWCNKKWLVLNRIAQALHQSRNLQAPLSAGF